MENPNHEMTINNKRIWTFYQENPTIDFETSSLLMIDILEKVFNKMTHDNSSSINSQMLTFMSENLRQMDVIKNGMVSVEENMKKMGTDFSNQLMLQFINSKKEYLDDMKQVIMNGSLTMNEKISSIIEKNNLYLIDKTSLILNDHVPRQIKDSVKDVYSLLKAETDSMVKSCNSDKSLQEFIGLFDQRFSSILQNIQQPLYSFFTATEDRILKNIGELRETSGESMTTQTKMFSELAEFLGKYKNSSHKGKMAEEKLQSLLNDLFPSADLTDTSGTKASGDIIMRRVDKPVILFENKEYDRNTDKEEVAKFIRDIDVQNTHGIFISQHSGIALKNNFQIEIHKGNILVYIQHCEYAPEKIKVAVDIIDSLSVKVEELNGTEENTISQEVLDEINKEYQDFIQQKELAITCLKDYQKKMTQLIDNIKIPALEKYLEPKYACLKSASVLCCDICKVFNAPSKQSLSAHKRGCAKKVKTEPNLENVLHPSP